MVTVAAVVVTGALVGCDSDGSAGQTGGGNHVDDGCPQLPRDEVRRATVDLADKARETGRLPVLQEGLAYDYSCSWRARDADEVAVVVTAEHLDAGRVEQAERAMREFGGTALRSTAPGFGFAAAGLPTDAGNEARWVCGDVVLDVRLYRPRSDDDVEATLVRLTEAVIPLVGCEAVVADSTPPPSPAPSP